MTDTRVLVLDLLVKLRGRGWYSAGEVAAVLELPRQRVKKVLDELASDGSVQTQAMKFQRNGGSWNGTGYSAPREAKRAEAR